MAAAAGATGKSVRASAWRCGLTSKCSRQAGGSRAFARALIADGDQRNVGWCGHRLDRLQLICIPLGGRPTPAQAGRTHLPAGRRPDIRGHSETPVRPRGATNLWEGK
jgi:hypothetical protein